MKIEILIFFFILKNASSYTKDGKDFKDCSYKFKNRMASFEYLYYPGSYVYPTGKENVAVKVSDEDTLSSQKTNGNGISMKPSQQESTMRRTLPFTWRAWSILVISLVIRGAL